MRTRSTVVVTIALLAASALLTSCSDGGRVICDYAQDSGTFIGPLVELHGPKATFRVERVEPNPSRTGVGLARPVKGRLIVVHYERDEQQFLRVGRRYSVKVWSIDGFYSSVHVAGHTCSGGTVYADGSAINTSLWSQSRTRHLVLALASALLLVGLAGGVVFVRARRRQRRNVDELRARAR